jgi:hypothetical protein
MGNVPTKNPTPKKKLLSILSLKLNFFSKKNKTKMHKAPVIALNFIEKMKADTEVIRSYIPFLRSSLGIFKAKCRKNIPIESKLSMYLVPT